MRGAAAPALTVPSSRSPSAVAGIAVDTVDVGLDEFAARFAHDGSDFSEHRGAQALASMFGSDVQLIQPGAIGPKTAFVMDLMAVPARR